jgi:hypothetical protein
MALWHDQRGHATTMAPSVLVTGEKEAPSKPPEIQQYSIFAEAG